MSDRIKYLFDLVLFSNIFIALCAATMAAETFLFLGNTPNWGYLLLLFFSSVVLYNFPVVTRLGFTTDQSPRHTWVMNHRSLIVWLFSISLAGTIICTTLLPLSLWFVMIPVSILALGYFLPSSGIRKVAGIKVFVITLVWMIVGVVIPWWLHSTSFPELNLENIPAKFVLSNALFMLPLCILFLIRDKAADQSEGMIPFPFTRSEKVMRSVSAVLLWAFALTVLWLDLPATWMTAYVVTGTIGGAVSFFAHEKSNDYYYTFIIDGLIGMKSALVLFIILQT